MSLQWFLYKNGEQLGPYSREEFYRLAESGVFGAEDLVWTEGMENWTRADQVEGLFAILQPLPFSPPSSSPDTTYQPPGPAGYQTAPTSKKGKGGLNALIVVLAVMLLGGGFVAYNELFRDRSQAGTAALKKELPEEVWAAVSSNFTFEPEITQLMYDMSENLSEHDFDMQWWVFSFPGSVDEAYGTLLAPPDSNIISPHIVPIVGVLNLHIILWELEIEELRGSAWLDEACARATTWEDEYQSVGEIRFTTEALAGAEESVPDNEDPYVTWALVVISPLIDLSELNLIEGTYLVVSRFQIKF